MTKLIASFVRPEPVQGCRGRKKNCLQFYRVLASLFSAHYSARLRSGALGAVASLTIPKRERHDNAIAIVNCECCRREYNEIVSR